MLDPLSSVSEKQVKAALSESLDGKSPHHTARELLGKDRKRRLGRRTLRAGAATAACLLLILASIYLPGVARALSSVPFVGEAYLNFIKGSGLDIAYQAGFVSELGCEQERYGITLTVLGAYSDSTETSVMFTLSSDDHELIQQAWEGSFTPWADPNRLEETKDLRPWLKGAGSGSSTMEYDETEGIIYGLVSVDSKRGLFGFARNKTLQIEAGAYGEPVWEVSFPVQTIPSEYIETVKVNKTFNYDNRDITVEEIIFSPAQTVLVYSTKNAGGSSGQFYNWVIETSQAVQLRSLGGKYSTGGVGFSNTGHGLVRFTPTDDRNLSIDFLGHNESFAAEIALPLVPGKTSTTVHGDFTIEDISFADDSTQVVLSWSGESVVKKIGAKLQNPVTKEEHIIDGLSSEEDLTLNFPQVDPASEWILLIEHVFLEERELIKVFEMP